MALQVRSLTNPTVISNAVHDVTCGGIDINRRPIIEHVTYGTGTIYKPHVTL
jgi:hypothetical protein